MLIAPAQVPATTKACLIDMKTLDLASTAQRLGRKTPWRDSLEAVWDRMMTSTSLYRWSVSNPLTRWITQRRARQVFDLMAGFVYSQVLLACVRLRILETVAERPRTLEELAHAVLYQDMQDPVAMLKGTDQPGAMSQYWPYTIEEQNAQRAATNAAQAEKFARYSNLMSASQPFVVDEIFASYSFDEHRCVLDVGGGQGTFLGRLAQHAKHLQLHLFDLPEVAALARANFERQGIADRATANPGSFLEDALPRGADLVTLIRVAHDHPDADVKTALRAIFEALPVGGTLLLAEPMAQEPDETPHGDAYFHFYLLAMGAGRLRTARELMAMMAEAGFSNLELVPNPMPLQTQILVGRKPQGLHP